MAVTMKDIARLCGVGVGTVSRAINDDPGINAATREKILAVIREQHYVPNNSARNLKMTESNTVALLVMGIDNLFFTSMFGGFQKTLEKSGYDFLLQTVSQTENVIDVAMGLTMEKRLKGIIFLGGQINRSKEKLKTLPVPYVLCTVANEVPEEEDDSVKVAIDDEAESEKIVSYLLDKGHRRIAIITGNKFDTAVGQRRFHGYQKALEKHGIAYDEDLMIPMKDDLPGYTAKNGYAVMKEFLQKDIKATAVFATSDMVAFGAYKAIFEQGLGVPGDISVVGFDGLELGSYMEPALTTVAQPTEELVRASVDLLISQIKGEPVSRQIFKGNLLERESVQQI